MAEETITRAQLSKATSLYSVAQQLALSAGVTVSAAVLETSRELAGGALGAAQFPPAFFAVAAMSAASILFFLPLRGDAGAALSGHPARKVSAQEINAHETVIQGPHET